MDELAAALKIALANTYTMYSKAHIYHWNVEGIHFSQYHEFFGDIYTEVYSAVDPLAERIRTIDHYAPYSLPDLLSAKTLADDTERQTSIVVMLQHLLNANDEVISALNKAFALAQQNKLQGLMNFLADRLDVHAKHGWMIKASQKAIAGA